MEHLLVSVQLKRKWITSGGVGLNVTNCSSGFGVHLQLCAILLCQPWTLGTVLQLVALKRFPVRCFPVRQARDRLGGQPRTATPHHLGHKPSKSEE